LAEIVAAHAAQEGSLLPILLAGNIGAAACLKPHSV
jgi:hypothetical protein